MPEFIVHTTAHVTAQNRAEAVTLSKGVEPRSIRVSVPAPPGRHGYEALYQQPVEILDHVWDAYMDGMGPIEATGRPIRLPTLTQVGGQPQRLSLLFDLAITIDRETRDGS